MGLWIGRVIATRAISRGSGRWQAAFVVAALVLLLLRAVHGLSARRPRLRPQALGFREMAWGLVTLVLLAVGYRLGL